MANKIYEYKDDRDWYVGSYSNFGGVNSLSDYQTNLPLFEFSKIFGDEEYGFSSVTVLRYGSTTVCSPL